MNAINLIDGLDGLASGVALQALVATAICAWHRADPALALMAICLAGSVAGFLFHNFHPASIFMGDSGSLFLGYILGAASIWSSQKTATIVSFVLPAIVLAVPLLDTSLAIWRRALTGRRIFSADMDHIHHRLIANGWGQTRTVVTLYGVSLVFSGLSVLLVFDGRPWLNWPVLLIAAVLALGFARWLGYLRPASMTAMAETRRRNMLLRHAVRELEHRLLADDSDQGLSDALADFERTARSSRLLSAQATQQPAKRAADRRN
jgi:UDP-GlcNAc:undecaprenyl-phosphate GlcNAc-1-phosphate transferase